MRNAGQSADADLIGLAREDPMSRFASLLFAAAVVGAAAAANGNSGTGASATVSGCCGNVAGPGPVPPGFVSAGIAPSICGGSQNSATGTAATVSGGEHNVASREFASVGGGNAVTASGTDAWHAGQSPGFPTGSEY